MKLVSTGVLILLSTLAMMAGMVSAQLECGVLWRCRNLWCCNALGFCGGNHVYCASNICLRDCWNDERSDHRCGSATGNAPCGENRCCSTSNFCGSGTAYCASRNCAYRCVSGLSDVALPGNLTRSAIIDVVTEPIYKEMFPLQDDCPTQKFYSYDAFLSATDSFPDFGSTGDVATRKREVAAFFAQVSELTSGLCLINSTTADQNDFCTSPKWPCASGKSYNPRGPIQLVHNFNYALAGQALGVDLINNPEMVETDPVVSFKTAIWFWMTKHDSKPSCHDTVLNANSGTVRNIINSVFGHTEPSTVGESSVELYKRFCDIFGVSYGHGLKFWFDNKPSSELLGIQMRTMA